MECFVPNGYAFINGLERVNPVAPRVSRWCKHYLSVVRPCRVGTFRHTYTVESLLVESGEIF